MHKLIRRVATTGAVMTGVLALTAGTAFAGDCTNASKNLHAPGAGAQIIFSDTGIVYVSKGLQVRFAKGLVNPDTGAGFHGLVGFQSPFGVITTFIVGPNGELPKQAQLNGPACKGITSIDTYITQCLS